MPECPCPWKSAPESLPLFTFPLLSCYIFSLCFFFHYRVGFSFLYVLFLGMGLIFYTILHIICRIDPSGAYHQTIISSRKKTKYILVFLLVTLYHWVFCMMAWTIRVINFFVSGERNIEAQKKKCSYGG